MTQLAWGVEPDGDGWEGWVEVPMPEAVTLTVRARGDSRGGALARTMMGARDTCEAHDAMGFGFLASFLPDIINAVASIAEGLVTNIAQGQRREAKRAVLGLDVPTGVRNLALRIADELDRREAEALAGDVLGNIYAQQYGNPHSSNPYANQYGNPYGGGGYPPGYGPPPGYGYPPGAYAQPGYAPAYADPYGYGVMTSPGYGYADPYGYGACPPGYVMDPYGNCVPDPYGGGYADPYADPYGYGAPPSADPYGPVVNTVQVTPPPARQRQPAPAPGGGARPGAIPVVTVRPAPARPGARR